MKDMKPHFRPFRMALPCHLLFFGMASGWTVTCYNLHIHPASPI